MRAHRLRVSSPELEDVADFNGFAHDELARASICRAVFSFVHAANIGAERPGEVAAGRYVAKVVVQLIGAADQVLAAFEGLVDDHYEAVSRRGDLRIRLEPNRAQVARRSIEELLQLLGLHRAEFGSADRPQQFCLIHLVIAAQKRRNAAP